MFFPGVKRLRDRELVECWEGLRVHAHRVPQVGGWVVLSNDRYPDWRILGSRLKGAPSVVVFTRAESSDAEVLGGLGDGDFFRPVMVEHRVDEDSPYIIRMISSAEMQVRGDDLEITSKGGRDFLGTFRMVVASFREARLGLLDPDVQELRELLDFLNGSEVEG